MQPTIDNSKVARCRHIKADGVQCNTPAMKDQRFCYYHSQLERTFRKPTRPPQIVGVDTVAAIRIALSDVLNRIARGVIDHRDARLMLRGLQNATILLKLSTAVTAPEEVRIVTDTANLAPHVNTGASREGVGERPDGSETPDQVLRGILQRLKKAEAERKYPLPWKQADRNAEAQIEDAPACNAQPAFPGPSPYTMLPDEYEDEPAPEPVPRHQADDEDCVSEVDEVERIRAEVKSRVPRREPGAPAVCLLVRQPECEFAHLHDEIWDCPLNEYVPYTVPDLHPFVDDDSRCVLLHNIAKQAQLDGQPLDAGTRSAGGGTMISPLADVSPGDRAVISEVEAIARCVKLREGHRL